MIQRGAYAETINIRRLIPFLVLALEYKTVTGISTEDLGISTRDVDSARHNLVCSQFSINKV